MLRPASFYLANFRTTGQNRSAGSKSFQFAGNQTRTQVFAVGLQETQLEESRHWFPRGHFKTSIVIRWCHPPSGSEKAAQGPSFLAIHVFTDTFLGWLQHTGALGIDRLTLVLIKVGNHRGVHDTIQYCSDILTH